MEFYNKISRGYDELYGEEQSKKLKVIKDNIKINKNCLLLDVGCGTGVSSEFGCNVVGIDPSLELLKQNKKTKINSAAERLPFKDKTFDVVISVTAIHNFKDIEKALKEMKRVGKNKFVFSVLKRSRKFKQIERLIKKHFRIHKKAEEEKDVIFFCE